VKGITTRSGKSVKVGPTKCKKPGPPTPITARNTKQTDVAHKCEEGYFICALVAQGLNTGDDGNYCVSLSYNGDPSGAAGAELTGMITASGGSMKVGEDRCLVPGTPQQKLAPYRAPTPKELITWDPINKWKLRVRQDIKDGFETEVCIKCGNGDSFATYPYKAK